MSCKFFGDNKMAAVSNSDSSTYYYIPIWNELSGTYQLITGLFQRQCASWQKDQFGQGHPRPLVVKQMNREGKENIAEGIEKLKTSAIVISLIALAYL